MRTLEHPNGLILDVDENQTASKTQAGYRVTPANSETLRSPGEIEITLQPDPEPAGPWPHSKQVDGRQVWYRVEGPLAGGSGGNEYTMTAWVACSGRHIVLREQVQAETEREADFRSAFETLSRARCASIP